MSYFKVVKKEVYYTPVQKTVGRPFPSKKDAEEFVASIPDHFNVPYMCDFDNYGKELLFEFGTFVNDFFAKLEARENDKPRYKVYVEDKYGRKSWIPLAMIDAQYGTYDALKTVSDWRPFKPYSPYMCETFINLNMDKVKHIRVVKYSVSSSYVVMEPERTSDGKYIANDTGLPIEPYDLKTIWNDPYYKVRVSGAERWYDKQLVNIVDVETGFVIGSVGKTEVKKYISAFSSFELLEVKAKPKQRIYRTDYGTLTLTNWLKVERL